MIDYTYWQQMVRQKEVNESIVWLELNKGYYSIAVAYQNSNQLLMETAEKWGFTISNQVGWNFRKQGELIVSKSENHISEDRLMLIGLSCGLKEVYFDDGDLAYFICPEHKLEEMDAILFLEDIAVKRTIQSYRPLEMVEIYQKEDLVSLFQVLNELSALENIVDICCNFCFDEGKFAQLQEQNNKPLC